MSHAKLATVAAIGAGTLGIGLLAWMGSAPGPGDPATAAGFVELPPMSAARPLRARPTPTPVAGVDPLRAGRPEQAPSPPPTEDPYAG